MSLSRKKANPQRKEEEEEEEGLPKWSELCPHLLRCVFKRLSFTVLNRAKSVCSSWHSASRGCVPKQNQIPWLILFPHKDNNNDDNSNNSCVLFVPEDKDKVYTSRNLGVDFVKSRCLTTCGSWILMLNRLQNYLYIVNLLTGERIDLPDDANTKPREQFNYDKACFWIDNKTKDYLVIWMRKMQSAVFTKKGDNKWQEFAQLNVWYKQFLYNHKDQKLYAYSPSFPIKIWDFSQDCIPRVDGNLFDFTSWLSEEDKKLYWEKLRYWTTRMAVTVSGDVLIVVCILFRSCKTRRFRIYKMNHVERKWVTIDSLGDEALIYDIGTTVVANDVPGIKRNSIYFSGFSYCRNDQDDIFVFDLTTRKMEPLPKCVFSNIHSNARWFFPC